MKSLTDLLPWACFIVFGVAALAATRAMVRGAYLAMFGWLVLGVLAAMGAISTLPGAVGS